MKDQWQCPHCAENAEKAVEEHRKTCGEWVLVKDAPLNELGFLWCKELKRTDMTGYVYEYQEEGRFSVINGALGFKATHWMPLPAPPVEKAPQ